MVGFVLYNHKPLSNHNSTDLNVQELHDVSSQSVRH
jgi:hypothetical protein